jgi:hypothetical protein
MSDLPELNLFEEIQGIANSADYYTYTQDQFDKTWSYYEQENAMDTKEIGGGEWRTSTPVSRLPTPPSSGKSSPTRDAWDPMLWHTRTLEEAELRALAELGPLSPPVSPAVMATVSTSEVTPVFEAIASKLMVTTISAADLPVSGCLTGSNRLVLPSEGSRAAREGPGGKPGAVEAGAGPSQKESQIVSRKRGINYTPRTLSKASSTIESQVRRSKKLYEMKPFSDPTREKERQNAVSAKRNRDKKKGLVSEAEGRISKLKMSNKRLSQEAVANKRRLLAAIKEIKLLRKKLESS